MGMLGGGDPCRDIGHVTWGVTSAGKPADGTFETSLGFRQAALLGVGGGGVFEGGIRSSSRNPTACPAAAGSRRGHWGTGTPWAHGSRCRLRAVCFCRPRGSGRETSVLAAASQTRILRSIGGDSQKGAIPGVRVASIPASYRVFVPMVRPGWRHLNNSDHQLPGRPSFALWGKGGVGPLADQAGSLSCFRSQG